VSKISGFLCEFVFVFISKVVVEIIRMCKRKNTGDNAGTVDNAVNIVCVYIYGSGAFLGEITHN